MINIGLVGLGHIGHYHVRALMALDQFNLVAAIDKNPELKRLLPEGVIFFVNAGDFFASGLFDTVIVATPNNTHYEFGIASSHAGKNVIMEKPAAITMDEFNELNSAFHASKQQHIYYAFHAAKAYEVSWFKEYLNMEENKKILGPVTAFSCNFLDPYFCSDRLAETAKGLCNPWLDSGVNVLSVLHELMDIKRFHVEEVYSTYASETTIQVQAQVRFPIEDVGRRGLGIINANWAGNLNHKQTVLLFGLTGYTVKLNHSTQQVFLVRPDGVSELLKDFSSSGERLYNHYIGVFNDYFDCYKKGSFNHNFARIVHEKLFLTENRRLGL